MRAVRDPAAALEAATPADVELKDFGSTAASAAPVSSTAAAQQPEAPPPYLTRQQTLQMFRVV